MNPQLIARFLSRSAAHGAAAGAGVGAGVGAVRAATAAPDEYGQKPGVARGALIGALKGGVIGGVGGHLGRSYRDARLLDPKLTASQGVIAGAQRVGQGIANFGKRQIHGLTGKLNPDAIGMAGNAQAAQKAKLVSARFADEAKHMTPAQLVQAQGAHAAELKNIATQGAAAQRAQDAGLTSLPGIYRAMKGPGRGAAFRAMGSTLASGAGAGGLALGVGVPVAAAAPSLLKGDESAQGGATMRQKLLRVGGNIGVGAMTAGLPIVPQLLAGTAIEGGVHRLTQPRGQQS